jgi:PKD domain
MQRRAHTVCFYSYIPGTGCSDSLCRSVVVTGTTPCHITAVWTSQTGPADSVTFAAADTNSSAHHVWNLGDGTIVSGSTQVSHHYAHDGAYPVCLYVYIPGTNCSDSLCQTVNAVLGVGNVAEAWPQIVVMPNPFSRYTLIKVEGNTEPYELIVYDALGKVLRREAANDNAFIFERGHLAAGIYVYEVQLHGQTVGKGKLVAE